MTRLRVRFAKQGKICWTSHRDTARMWERALRRAELPVAYSCGFSPRPKVSFGLALSTGYQSLAEYLDIELSDRTEHQVQLDVEALRGQLSAALPQGVDVLAIAAGTERLPSLQEDVTSCTWRLQVAGADHDQAVPDHDQAVPDVGSRVDALLASDACVITRSRKGRSAEEDIRPAVLAIRPLEASDTGLWLECDLATQPRSLRPTELVSALGVDLEERSVCRLHQWIERDGARREPICLPLAATDAPHALVRAS